MLSQQELKKWQDDVFSMAKNSMTESGDHVPLAFLVTQPNLISDTSKKGLAIRDITNLDKKKPVPEAIKESPLMSRKDLKDGETIFLTVPLFFSAHDEVDLLVEMLQEKVASVDKEKARDIPTILASLKMFGQQANVPDVDQHIANALKKLMGGIHIKDVQAYVLRRAIAMSGAYAFCKIDEMYTLDQDDSILPEEIKKAIHSGSLHEHPKRKEGLGVQLETTEITRLLFAEVIKEGGRDTDSKVLGFKETRETLHEYDKKGAKIEGRFTNLLRKAVEAEPPSAKA